MDIDPKTIKILKTWGVAMILFFAVALVCVGFIFAPVTEHIGDMIIQHSAISLQGGALLAESWKKYPQYTWGLGIAAGLSFIGGCYCIYMMYKKDEE